MGKIPKWASKSHGSLPKTWRGAIEWINSCLAEDFARHPYVIKTCQAYVADKSRDGRRKGSFHFTEKQHKILLDSDGCYVLIREGPGYGCRFLIVRAKDLPFQKNITWSHIFPPEV